MLHIDEVVRKVDKRLYLLLDSDNHIADPCLCFLLVFLMTGVCVLCVCVFAHVVCARVRACPSFLLSSRSYPHFAVLWRGVAGSDFTSFVAGLSKPTAYKHWVESACTFGDLVARPGFEDRLSERAFGSISGDHPLGLDSSDLPSLAFFSPRACRLLLLHLHLHRYSMKRVMEEAHMESVLDLIAVPPSSFNLLCVFGANNMQLTSSLWGSHRSVASPRRSCTGRP